MKAQTELVGLAFILAIVIVAGAIAISLSGKQTTTENYKQLAEHTLQAVLYTTITCDKEQVEIRDLARECGKYCDCMQQETQKLLAFTFEKENLDYEFKIIKGTDIVADKKTTACGERATSTGTMILPGKTENAEAVLKLCKKGK